jgi:hypothetical protein
MIRPRKPSDSGFAALAARFDFTSAATAAPSTRHFQSCHRSERPPHARAPHAGRMTCSGRSPGLRVMTLPRLPGLRPKSPVAYRRRINRSQLRAQLRIWLAIDESKPHRIPFADRGDQHPKQEHSKLTRVCCQGAKTFALQRALPDFDQRSASRPHAVASLPFSAFRAKPWERRHRSHRFNSPLIGGTDRPAEKNILIGLMALPRARQRRVF